MSADAMQEDDLNLFVERDGILVSRLPVAHRDEEYGERGFDILLEMQRKHFWYLGRHRFLLRTLKKELPRIGRPLETLAAVDLGGGCGGWLEYLRESDSAPLAYLALADSSLRALTLAGPVVGSYATRFQVDLLELRWVDRWDVVFLLDTLEHIPQDATVMRRIREVLRPNGLLFVTTPALQFFWSYNDEIGGHQRRYSRRDFRELAHDSGLRLVTSRYFMFFLSPMLWLSRLRPPSLHEMSEEEIFEHLRSTHRVPAAPINQILRAVFSLETPLGVWMPFPWGTSILGVFQKS